jgi:hypothetical protein
LNLCVNYDSKLGNNRAQVRYWFLKQVLGDQFHGQSVGGRRKGTFTLEEKPIVHEFIVHYFAAFPKASLADLALEVSESFQRVTTKRVCKIFNRSHFVKLLGGADITQ